MRVVVYTGCESVHRAVSSFTYLNLISMHKFMSFSRKEDTIDIVCLLKPFETIGKIFNVQTMTLSEGLHPFLINTINYQMLEPNLRVLKQMIELCSKLTTAICILCKHLDLNVQSEVCTEERRDRDTIK